MLKRSLAILLPLIMVFSCIVTVSADNVTSNELIIDSGFELGFQTKETGWEKVHENTSINTENVYNGNNSLKLGSWASEGVYTAVNIQNGVQYELSFYHKGEPSLVHLHSAWIGSTGTSDVLDKQKTGVDKEFTKYTYTFKANKTGTVFLYLASIVSGDAYIDDVSLRVKGEETLNLDYSNKQEEMIALVTHNKYKSGEKVVLNFNLPANYFVSAGSVYYVTQNSGVTVKINKSNGDYVFYMPSEPVKVYAKAFDSGLSGGAVSTFGSSIKESNGKDESGIQFGSVVLKYISENGSDYKLKERGTILLRAKGIDIDGGVTQKDWYDTLKADGTPSNKGYAKGVKLVSLNRQDETKDFIQYSARIYGITEEEKEDYTFSAYGYAVYTNGTEDIVKFSDRIVYRKFADGEIGNAIIGGTSTEEFKLSSSADSYEDYINELYYASGVLSATDTEKGVEVVSDKMKQDILNAPDTVKATGTTYYVSTSGKSYNSGKTEISPWNLAKLNSSYNTLKAGDAVLFKRGETFTPSDRNSYAFIAKNGVSYGTYGTGDKPLFSGSLKNYSGASNWTATDKANVYKCTTKFDNISNIVLNYTGEIGNSDELVATKKIAGLEEFNDYTDMAEDMSYYCDRDTDTLYFCSTKGNPGEVYDRIDIGGYEVLVKNDGALLIENLSFVFGGYGIADDSNSGTDYMNVKGCTFGYIGGQMYSDTTVCGNAIETFGSVDGFYVENCWMYQICDTAVTHQDWSTTGDGIQKNIKISGNVMEYCFWGIEFNNSSSENGTRKTENVDHSYNVIFMTGYGYGKTKTPRVDQHPTAYNVFGNADLVNVKAEKNVIYRSSSFMYFLTNAEDKTIDFIDNLNIQDSNKSLTYIVGSVYLFNEESRKKFENLNSSNINTYIRRIELSLTDSK